ncbi:hypothetical protein KY495_10840 [Massilia sp. PAMC28688]|uniref:hypothetical protein n=1 Tax=Massilia sp. PAMC28688 TaxID=2861283 RepID=UPI001C628BB0|nr:hypothetical protein [Massilia sp. PAMC28688]QYF95595.1 hypothetical protein KY495_10840 [Massilia sp. PAMC28688]
MHELKAVFKQAISAFEANDFEGALRHFVWLHDNPNRNDLSSEMFRRANGFLAWGGLATKYPPARQKLQELLAIKVAHLRDHPEDTFVKADAGAMQQALNMFE